MSANANAKAPASCEVDFDGLLQRAIHLSPVLAGDVERVIAELLALRQCNVDAEYQSQRHRRYLNAGSKENVTDAIVRVIDERDSAHAAVKAFIELTDLTGTLARHLQDANRSLAHAQAAVDAYAALGVIARKP